ncbi:MAG: metallophosphoesterase, partial [Thermoanaerobaculia bacterium]
MRTFRALLALTLFTGCASMAPPPQRFKILQINDVYKIEGLEGGQSGGLARVRTLREQLESDGTAVLVLHGGDALYPSVMSKYLDAAAMVDVLNVLDGDADGFDPALILTFGNHEFDNKTADILLKRMRESQFPWVSANALYCSPSCGRFPQDEETLIREVNGLRIGIFGVMYPLKKDYVQTTDVEDAARAAVANLRRQGADVIIAITHEDMSDDVELARAVPEIDLVIGGHDHLFLQDQVGDTWITKADADAKSVIVYDVTVDRGKVRTAPLRVVLDATMPK